VQRREQRPGALGGEDGVGVDLLAHAGGQLEVQAAARRGLAGVAGTALLDQLLVGAARERRVDHVLVAQARHLLGLEAPVERLLDVDDAQLAGYGMEGVGIAVAVVDAGGELFVHLVEVAADEDEQAAVVGLPLPLAALAEGAQPLLDLLGRPGHDLQQRFVELEVALQLLSLPAAQLEAQPGVRGLGAFGVEGGLGDGRFDVAQQRERRRQAAVGQQGPDVLVALDAQLAAFAVDGAKALELVEREDAGLALAHAGLRQHARDALRAAPARAVGEAVHLHFDEAVVETQQLGQAAHELGFAGAGQSPEADDDGPRDELGHLYPSPHRIDDAVDDGVDAEQLGLELGGDLLQLLVSLRQLHAQIVGLIHPIPFFAAAPAAPRGRLGAGRRGSGCVGLRHASRAGRGRGRRGRERLRRRASSAASCGAGP
jgi:hypothetical protein